MLRQLTLRSKRRNAGRHVEPLRRRRPGCRRGRARPAAVSGVGEREHRARRATRAGDPGPRRRTARRRRDRAWRPPRAAPPGARGRRSPAAVPRPADTRSARSLPGARAPGRGRGRCGTRRRRGTSPRRRSSSRSARLKHTNSTRLPSAARRLRVLDRDHRLPRPRAAVDRHARVAGQPAQQQRLLARQPDERRVVLEDRRAERAGDDHGRREQLAEHGHAVGARRAAAVARSDVVGERALDRGERVVEGGAVEDERAAARSGRGGSRPRTRTGRRRRDP